MTPTDIPRFPRRLGDLRVHSRGDGALLESRHANPVAMNPTAAALWELCDGETTVEEMVIAVCRVFSVDEERATADVRAVLMEMQTRGLIA